MSFSPFSETVYHATSDITTGMSYATRSFDLSENHSNELIKLIKEVDHSDEMDEVLRTRPLPLMQKYFNTETTETEQMKLGGGFDEIGKERPSMVKCTEWIEEQVIRALWRSGVLRKWELRGMSREWDQIGGFERGNLQPRNDYTLNLFM